MPTSTTFQSQGVALDAWHFPAVDDRLATPAGRPCVVMAHGFAGTKDCGLESFGENLAAAGLDVLAFDYRGFGASAGEPRQVISLSGQVEDYQAALRTAAQLPGVDPDRLVLWGVSMSGGLVLEVAAGRTDIAAVIALTPLVTSNPDKPAPAAPLTAPDQGLPTNRAATTARLLAQGIRDKRAAAAGRARVLLPAVGRPGEVALLNLPGTYDDYASIAGPTWRNEVNASIAIEAMRHRPNRFAKGLRVPILFQIADFDRCVSVGAAVKAAVQARAQIRHYPCDHFDVYPGKPWHESISEHQVRFLTGVLTPAAVPA
ncbi:alpha/beta fold hydrolase [Nocardia sp. 348MFTsu5.1]|uniref:alpha/beta hydrolase n=1 Tax=Nocardia sp. 348MFTsu5.1 TaxID=1172185 RepID=UPI0003750398|nr:alpha/beta fold hydrolase [Nocardia sp. 348MFTsu5.1]